MARPLIYLFTILIFSADFTSATLHLHCDEEYSFGDNFPSELKKARVEDNEALSIPVKFKDTITIDTLESFDLTTLVCGGNIIVSWDIDDTLLYSENLLFNFHALEQKHAIWEYLQDTSRGNHKDFPAFMQFCLRHFVDYSHPTRKESLLETHTLPLIQSLSQRNNVTQVGLTTRKPLIAETTHVRLVQKGVDFTQLSTLPATAHTDPNLNLFNGCFYTQNQQNKIYTIPHVVEHMITHAKINGPLTLIHLDNNKSEIDAIQNARNRLYSPHDLTILPVHYRYFEKKYPLPAESPETYFPWIEELYTLFLNERMTKKAPQNPTSDK